jgi:hypothetical protein
MILEIEPLENGSIAKCHHRRCDGRSAKWRFPQTRALPAGEVLSCSVHIPHLGEIVESYSLPPASERASAVLVERLPASATAVCPHPRCDGRHARWGFPQTRHLPTEEYRSCSVHIARFCELVLTYHAVDVPISFGRRRRAHDERRRVERTQVA